MFCAEGLGICVSVKIVGSSNTGTCGPEPHWGSDLLWNYSHVRSETCVNPPDPDC